ncbi:ABC transporter substrate-binding protein [Psychroflexus sediminis]|uniref:Iron complex transport system substrate-binding protein n=1 Tax=Psychroflexus sediminis TaxID=470826 RepID=A0A1G7VCE6_9FLAO|nr:ABC transporter substrate-binding protein [Psychroflexus sediminis]SDG57515.1 iron complex transport system substrate-binding protein [Psychroflexus sediminis]
MKPLLYFFIFLSLFACKKADKTLSEDENYEEVEIKYATGFSIHKYPEFTKVIVHSPWPDAEKDLVYILVDKPGDIPEHISYDAVIHLPVEKLVTTSTTHIPSLITLNKIDKLVGFPNLDFISSEKARALINAGKVKELGKNESLNTEILLSVNPDVVFSFGIEGQNKTLNQIQKSGIPVVYNGDWLEKDVLGKAEWIKFFGVFLGELDLSIEAFDQVETDYKALKEKAEEIAEKPSVISGAMHQDRWYLPYGTSWQAQLFEDANAEYVYKDTRGKGSAAFSFEKVLEDAKAAEFWISPAQFTSYAQLLESNMHYQEFEAFQEKNIYTMASTTGETGGVLFYEIGPNRPDLVLKDLVKIFHPELLENEEFTFFKALEIE